MTGLIPASDIVDVAEVLRQIRVPAGEQLAVEVVGDTLRVVSIDASGWIAAGYGVRHFTPAPEARRG